MEAAVAATDDYRSTAESLADQVAAMLDSYIGAGVPETPGEAGGWAHPEIAGARHDRDRDVRSARVTFDADRHAATAGFEAAQFIWEQAVCDYDHALSSAETMLRSTADDAACSSGTPSCAIKVTVAGAVQEYTASAGTAAAALADAAGAMLAAYAAYTSAIIAAEAKRLLAEATTNEAYRRAVESPKG